MNDNKDNDNELNSNDEHKKREATPEELLSLEEDISELRRKLEEEKNRHLRTMADFDNFRKRVERDAEASRVQIKKEILLDLLTFLDYFEQAKKQVHDPAAAAGIEIMARQFNELLHKHGARPIECIGQPFDPEEQEGVGFLETESCPGGCVAEEICTGWKLGDLLLKPAQVMVARKPGNDKEKQETGEKDY